ncbi:MAG: hypothetical protein PHQ86_05200 [Dehalococcoidales bacterium]|nr:hypothetical protein [Dehalococcoidales bacterium]
MKRVKIDAFLSIPACSGGVSLSRLLNEIEEEYGEKVEIIFHKGRNEVFEQLNLTTAPALVIGDLVRIMGVCPSKESLVSALKEAGME